MDLSVVLGYLWPLLYISPAYAANSTPLFIGNIIKGKKPLDLGLRFRDGRRILGDGKTFEGTIAGFFVGLIYFLTFYYLDKKLSILNLYINELEGLTLIVGAIIGDLLGSFLKRRLGVERGEMLPVFDQTGFLIFAILIRSIFFGVVSYDLVLYLFVMTFLIHMLTNLAAHRMGIKEKPF